MKKALLLLVGIAMLALSGCYKHTLTVGSGADTAGSPKVDEMQLFFIAGLVGEYNGSVADACPSGNAVVKMERNLIQGLITNFTWNLVTLEQVQIWCGEGGASHELTSEQKEDLLANSNFSDRLKVAVEEQSTN